jgi:hypothetical protein
VSNAPHHAPHAGPPRRKSLVDAGHGTTASPVPFQFSCSTVVGMEVHAASVES